MCGDVYKCFNVSSGFRVIARRHDEATGVSNGFKGFRSFKWFQ